MSKIAIVTDSTATIPADLIKPYQISVVPLQVIWGHESQQDGVDVTPTQFYTRLKNSKVMPSTSQPSPAAFQEVYTRLLEEGYEILSIHISNKLSGTIASATQAKAMILGGPIEIIDSDSTAMAMGFQVLQAARMAAQGATLRECKAMLVQSIPNVGALFAVSTLEFLHRGGRIGAAAAFLGTALNLKPILELTGGKIEPVERVRTMSKAVDRLLDLLENKIGNQTVRLGSIHADAPEQAEMLMEKARERFGNGKITEAVYTEVSPVLGSHTGPGTVGMTYMIGM
jgi:DegV family protein with EDD domain